MALLSRTKFILAISIATSMLLSACGNATPQVVRVAVNLPLGIPIGQDMLNAMKLALTDANGKAGNIPVEIRAFDSSDPKGNPLSVDLAVSETKDAIADSSIVAYIGPVTSDQSRSTIPLLNAVSMAQVSAMATWPGLTKPGFGVGEPGIYYPTGQRTFFRIVPSDDVQGLMATHWIKQLGAKTVYLISDKSLYSQGLTGIFQSNAQDQGLTIVGKDQVDITNASADDLNAVVGRISAAAPDALYYPPGDNAAGKLLTALHAADPKLLIVGTDAVTSVEQTTAENLDGIYATNVVVSATQIPSAADFLAHYQAAYNKMPPPYALPCYAAMQVVLQAIKQADTPTRAGVLAAMSRLGNITNALGTWHFDANGDTSLTTISGLQLKNGQWTPVTVINS